MVLTPDERLQQMRDNAVMLRELCTPPSDKDRNNAKVYTAQYFVGEQMVAATLVVQQGAPVAAVVTKRFGDNLTSSQKLQGEYLKAEDHAVFLGLDECIPRTPRWAQDKLTSSDLVIMRGAIGQPVNGR